ncbi:long-chain fatty acid--CoA ligase [Verticiella sediminum]|uniref:Long-chain fatty acid--CoA ligase n=1 Tax=Verticiella sediminum TaxID=1247510 RepID=A0A556AU44_9BURK|nr:AMP-binding protein [Verticiella sediminum]TSH96440.1 long-chain fatty acid--CoA ligase [Verticiella sediminum]
MHTLPASLDAGPSLAERLGALPARLHAVIDPWVRSQPDALAIEDPQRRYTYAQFDAAVRDAADRLAGLGLRGGDRLLIAAENCAALAVLFFAASRLDAWACVVNARLAPAELDAIHAHSGARLAVFLDADSPAARSHAERVHARRADWACIGPFSVTPADPQAVAEAVAAAPEAQVAALIYTSGTTGLPKGVMLTHRNLVFIGDAARRNRAITPADTAYGILPMSHVYGLASVLIGMLYSGGALRIESRFDPAEVVRAWRDDGITIMHGVAAMYARLLAWSRETGTSLRGLGLRVAQGGGGPLSQALKDDFETSTGVTLHLGYGMTEAAPTIAQTRLDAPRPDVSSGPPIAGVAVRRVAEDGSDADPGEVGEIWVRGPNVMKGYYRDPEQTAAALTPDGWLRTGDLGVQDDAGNINIVGRAKDMIIRSGFNVYPTEVESALNAHPDVLQSAVLGRPAGDNEDIVAFIEPIAGAPRDAQRLLVWLRGRLSPYKIPTHVIYLEQLPAASTGKVLKKDLKQRLLDGTHP